MHKEILTEGQKSLLPFLRNFSGNFGLVGGTAIALHIGHRKSLDFDLFSNKEFDNFDIQRIILKENKKIDQAFIDSKGEYTILIDGIKITFFNYPFKIDFSENLDDYIPMGDLLTLAALKAYALGRRAKWKDYVDLYFIISSHFSINEVVKKAEQIFSNSFNEKILRSQLSYFKDLDFSEKIVFLEGHEKSDKEIQKSLVGFSLS